MHNPDTPASWTNPTPAAPTAGPVAYDSLAEELEALLAGEDDPIATAANAAAAI